MRYPSNTSPLEITAAKLDAESQAAKIIREEIKVALGLWAVGLIPLAIVYFLFVS